MINYQNGKIYAIKSYQTELIYIGSTTRPLSHRLGQHRTYYKNNTAISSKEILKYPDYYIELIELFQCNSREELEKQEGMHIRKNINICVNCCIAGRTKKEWNNDNKEHLKEYQKKYHEDNKEKNKEYYEDNKERIREQKKKYNEDNKERIREQKKKYNEDNKERIREQKKKYREDNKERIREQKKKYREDNKKSLNPI
jgi:hypothetical protein